MILIVAFRNLIKRPFLNLVKIAGLVIALTCIILIGLYVHRELTYDSFHEKSDRIYRLTLTHPEFFEGKHFARIYYPTWIKEMKNHFPEVENYVRLSPVRGGIVKYNEKNYNLNQGFICDSTYLKVFNANLIIGNKQNVLNHPGSMLITESYAQKLFGNSDPIGEVVTIPAGQFYAEPVIFTVRGIMEDYPSNCHFHPDFIATAPDGRINGWGWSYLMLRENADPEKVLSGFEDFFIAKSGSRLADERMTAHLQPINKIHLNSDKMREIEEGGNMANIYVLLIAAAILLLISISNYSNLNIGTSWFYSKYIYVNKLLGSGRRGLVRLLLADTGIIIAITLLLSFFSVAITGNIIIRNYNLNLIAGRGFLLTTIVLIFILITVGAGMLPAIRQFLSFLKNKNHFQPVYKKPVVSGSLIVFQYAFAIIMIIAVLVITRQMNFALDKGLGMKQDNVFCFESVHQNVQQKFEVYKQELLKYGSIKEVTAMMEPPGGEALDLFTFELEGYESQMEDPLNDRIGIFPCDYSMPGLFNLSFLSGSDFSPDNSDVDGSGEYIINRAALKRLNYSVPEDIIGKGFKLNVGFAGINLPRGKIIGVVEDFHLSDLKTDIDPLVLFKRKDMWISNFIVASKPGMEAKAVSDIHEAWEKLFPEYSPVFEHIESVYGKVYKTELIQKRLLSVFTIIALLISSMGLLGISLIMVQRQVKEIGIRKVNGAKSVEILVMLNRNFIVKIIVGFVLACPLAWYLMNRWLENYAYRIGLSWWIFAFAGCVALIIAVLTVSWQSRRAASRNPVEALRYE